MTTHSLAPLEARPRATSASFAPRVVRIVDGEPASALAAPRAEHAATLLVSRRDLLRLLEGGAMDDLVVVPCREVNGTATRYAAAVPPVSAPEPIHFGPLRVDVAAREATVDGRPVILTRREFDLLAFFARNHGRAVRREELLARVWNSSQHDMQRTIDIHVRRLRAKLGKAFTLETVYRVGYRFRAPSPDAL